MTSEARIRVLHFIESEGLYGAESVIVNLSQEMQRDGRYVPIVGCIVAKKEERSALLDAARSKGFEAHPIVIANSLVWRDLPRAARQIKGLGVQVLHCHGYKPAVYAYLIGLLTGIRVIATCHLWFVDAGAPLKMRLMIKLEKLFYRRFPSVVAVSDKIRKVLLESGVPPARVRVIRNGISVADTTREVVRHDRNEACKIVNVARLTAQKAQKDLIAATRILKDSGVNVKVFIAGEGELREQLQAQIRLAGLEGSVELLGFVSDVRSLLQQADIFALPSIDEGMPVSLLEAVSIGIPVVATAVGDVPELIQDGISGRIVAQNNPQEIAGAILDLLRDPDFAAGLANAAYQRLQTDFSSRRMFESYAGIYGELVAI